MNSLVRRFFYIGKISPFSAYPLYASSTVLHKNYIALFHQNLKKSLGPIGLWFSYSSNWRQCITLFSSVLIWQGTFFKWRQSVVYMIWGKALVLWSVDFWLPSKGLLCQESTTSRDFSVQEQIQDFFREGPDYLQGHLISEKACTCVHKMPFLK